MQCAASSNSQSRCISLIRTTPQCLSGFLVLSSYILHNSTRPVTKYRKKEREKGLKHMYRFIAVRESLQPIYMCNRLFGGEKMGIKLN